MIYSHFLLPKLSFSHFLNMKSEEKKIDQKVYMLFSGGSTLKNQNISYKDVGRGKFETNSFWILCKTLMWCLDRADSQKLDTEHVVVLNFV